MKILITGSSGFIGSEIVKQLQARGDEVMGVDLQEPTRGVKPTHFEKLDILEKDRLLGIGEDYQPEYIIHLAATHDLADITNELIGLDAYKVNTEGTNNILELASNTKSVKRVIFTSTQLISEIGHQVKSIEECRPHTYYGKSKLIGEQLIHGFQDKNYTWSIVRPTTVWGPGMNAHYQRFISYIRDGKYFHISNRPLYKSWSYIENIAWQYLTILNSDANVVGGKSYYLADYEPISLRDYANELQKNLHAKPIPTYPEFICKTIAKVGDVVSKSVYRKFPFTSFRVNNILNEYVYDLTDTQEDLGDVPVSFLEGVSKTTDWYQRLEKV